METGTPQGTDRGQRKACQGSGALQGSARNEDQNLHEGCTPIKIATPANTSPAFRDVFSHS